jgi:hypothetical protein
MADNKRKRGRADRRKVAGGQAYEVAYIAKKKGVSRAKVRQAIKKVGNSRRRIYAELRA